MNWHSIHTGLPPAGVMVDIWVNEPDGGRRYANVWWNESSQTWANIHTAIVCPTIDVTHWMYRPDSPDGKPQR